MAARGKRAWFGAAAGVLGLVLSTLCLPAPASAQGIFELIFGGLRHAIEAPSRMPTNIQAFVDPLTSLANANNPPPPQRGDTGPARAFCVRSCDGHFFPVQARAGVSAAEACHAFCPASQTRLYSGGSIDYAVASDGSRYADLDNAFVYRQRLVAGCTCNGRDQFGLAPMDVNADPTLRPGDVVATKSGLVAFTGARNKVAEFTPVGNYRGFSPSYRGQLSEMKIMPPTAGAPELTTSTLPSAANTRGDGRHSAQLER